MSEDAARFWEFAAKVIGAVVVLVTAYLSYQQYLETANREARKPYLERQLAFCIEAADAAGRIATADVQSAEDVARARATFQRLLWGPLAIFDNAAIADAMKRFDQGSAGMDRHGLAERVAHACRDLLIYNWQAEDPETVLERIERARAK
jgi:hypothetical protein